MQFSVDDAVGKVNNVDSDDDHHTHARTTLFVCFVKFPSHDYIIRSAHWIEISAPQRRRQEAIENGEVIVTNCACSSEIGIAQSFEKHIPRQLLSTSERQGIRRHILHNRQPIPCGYGKRLTRSSEQAYIIGDRGAFEIDCVNE